MSGVAHSHPLYVFMVWWLPMVVAGYKLFYTLGHTNGTLTVDVNAGQ